jgi:hypothetical protein
MDEQKSLKDTALAYESKSVGNIVDLPKVTTALKVEDREGTNDEGKTFQYKVIVVDGQEYRVPASVLKSLKAILDDNPELQEFKVKKSGTGMNTEYTVIPLK